MLSLTTVIAVTGVPSPQQGRVVVHCNDRTAPAVGRDGPGGKVSRAIEDGAVVVRKILGGCSTEEVFRQAFEA